MPFQFVVALADVTGFTAAVCNFQNGSKLRTGLTPGLSNGAGGAQGRVGVGKKGTLVGGRVGTPFVRKHHYAW